MAETIRAIYKNGKFEPSDHVSLHDGDEVILSISPAQKEDTFEQAAGTWENIVDCDQLTKNIYDSRLIETRQEPKL